MNTQTWIYTALNKSFVLVFCLVLMDQESGKVDTKRLRTKFSSFKKIPTFACATAQLSLFLLFNNGALTLMTYFDWLQTRVFIAYCAKS